MKINEDLLPISIDKTINTDKRINFKKCNNLLDIQFLQLMTDQSGTIVRTAGVWNVILNVKDLSYIYVSGDFSLLGDGTLRIGKFNPYPTLGVKGSRYSLGSSNSIDCRGVNYVLLSFLDSTGTSDWIDNVKNSFMVNVGNTPLPWEAYIKPSILVDGNLIYDKERIDSFMLSTSSIQENLCTVFEGIGALPRQTRVEYIDKNIFGIYTVVNDSGAPVSSHNNDWFTIINIPAHQGINFSIQIAFTYWDLDNVSYGVWMKHGRETTWKRVAFA